MFNTYEAVIKSCRCDLCKERAVGVEHVLRGTPIHFECRGCAPKVFQQAAESLAGRAIASAFGADPS